MGVAVVSAGLGDIVTLASAWARARTLRVNSIQHVKKRTNNDGHSKIAVVTAVGRKVVVKWTFEAASTGIVTRMAASPPWYFSLLMFASLYSALGLILVFLYSTPSRIQVYTTFPLGFVIGFMSSLWFTGIRPKLTKLEWSFWEALKQKHEVKLVLRAQGKLLTGWWALLVEIVTLVLLLCVGGALGTYGLIAVLLFFVPPVFVSLLKTKFDKIPQWHWRLWIVQNVGEWTMFCSCTLAALAFLVGAEGIMTRIPLGDYEVRANWSPAEIWGHFRSLQTYTATELETDAKVRLQQLGKIGALRLKKRKGWAFSPRTISTFVSATSLLLLFFLVFAMYFFVVITLRELARLWRHEVSWHGWQQGPCMPPLRGGWNYRGVWVIAAVVTHYLIQGMVNLLAGAFGLEGLSYVFTGKTLLRPESAQLWSWVFVWATGLFGGSWGRVSAVAVVIMVAFPFLLCCAKIVQRLVCSLLKCVKVLAKQLGIGRPDELLSLRAFVCEACSKSGLRKPIIMILDSREILVQIRWIPIVNTGVLELSQGAIEILNFEELKGVVAHELGHVRRGFFSIWLLKTLSVLAFFPNYYLTMCLNWAKREMEADRYALEITGNPQALRQALVKISTAELWTLPQTKTSKLLRKVTNLNRIKTIRVRTEELVVAARFFFGDGILGYTHPFLSERLAAIAAFEKQ